MNDVERWAKDLSDAKLQQRAEAAQQEKKVLLNRELVASKADEIWGQLHIAVTAHVAAIHRAMQDAPIISIYEPEDFLIKLVDSGNGKELYRFTFRREEL